ncbi:transmembrane protein 223 [Coccinella septempunctata]|uniref:transmembrane protein 223 n=1 Tax=Coccinella septempunctata TaxID=41139 RepID=UPI001D060001|nr:transmembrane protein 223 [Coccinella septempunctata]
MNCFLSLHKLKTICIPNLNKIIPRRKVLTFNTKFISSSAEVNTNVIKDVILYKYDNPRFFKTLNLFAIVQFGFWSYLSLTAYETLRDAPVKQNAEKWWEKFNLGENKYRYTITFASFLIGYGILVVSWMYTLRSVRFLILNKGGQKCTLVTYTPFGRNRMMTLGLENTSCTTSRHIAPSYIPIKVKGYLFHYLLDMRGEFKNPRLFDYTVGLRRNFNA